MTRLCNKSNELDFVNRCRFRQRRHRYAVAITENHSLRALSPLGLSDHRAPFFAEANSPSAKHSFQNSIWNLHPAFQAIARSAGLGNIIRLFDNMRMSRSNEVDWEFGSITALAVKISVIPACAGI